MSSTASERDRAARGEPAADRLGFKAGMVVQELGWDSDTDDELRVAIEDAIDADMVDGDYGNVVDAVLLWWRDEDGDLVDGLVDALTDLVGGGAIWLLTPKVGRPNAVDPADIAEAAPIAGLVPDHDGRGQQGLVGHPAGRPQDRRLTSYAPGVASCTSCIPLACSTSWRPRPSSTGLRPEGAGRVRDHPALLAAHAGPGGRRAQGVGHRPRRRVPGAGRR